MKKRLRAADLPLLAQESATTPLHNATLEIFAPGSEFTFDDLMAHVEDRIAYVPRYRQRLRHVPGGLSAPRWVEDARFDIEHHVRRSALPSPGTSEQLRDLVARVVQRRLDSSRPLWELYYIEGLAGGRVAILTKSHQVLVDGRATVDLGQVLLDTDPETRLHVSDDWEPPAEPTRSALVAEALRDNLIDPATAATTVRGGLGAAGRAASEVAGRLGRLVTSSDNGVGPLPFHLEHSQQRRVVLVDTRLKDYRTVRRAHGGTVNDVILATISGALRTWLLTRADNPRRIRALVPMSIIDEELEPTSLGSQVVGQRVTLPLAEASPVVRLHQVSYALTAHRETGGAVAADRIAGVAGFAPTTFHALGSRVALHDSDAVDLVITNVPGPQFPMFLAGTAMEQSYPIPLLPEGHGLAIGVTSYDGGVYYGITADRGGLPDIDVLGQCLREALDELVDSASSDRPRAPRGR